MKILGIETSCDETAVCLVEAEGEFGPDFTFNVLGNALSSQAALHARYGGVFPNVAKREHAKNLVPVLTEALRQAGMPPIPRTVLGMQRTVLGNFLEREPELLEKCIPFFEQHGKPGIDVIAVTYGPGLEPCLWVGVNFAKALSAVWNAPIVAVNHMEGHIVMSMMEMRSPSSGMAATFEFPALALLISGGHTELVLMREFGRYELIGQTRDDAAGEAFDKVARLLGLSYPGGPLISRLAAQARRQSVSANFKLPRPMLHEDNFDFSFSGLKTAVRRLAEEQTPNEEEKMKLAREFEDAVADVLVTKTLRAADAFGANTVVVGGGVSANAEIRRRLARKLDAVGCKLSICPPRFATDNAIMIALAGYFHAARKDFVRADDVSASGNLKLC